MKDMFKAFDYACNKFYYIIYNKYNLCEQRAEGLLLNYASGNIVLLSEKGMYHLKYNDIIFMKPMEPPTYRLSKEFNDLLNYFMEEDNT